MSFRNFTVVNTMSYWLTNYKKPNHILNFADKADLSFYQNRSFLQIKEYFFLCRLLCTVHTLNFSMNSDKLCHIDRLTYDM